MAAERLQVILELVTGQYKKEAREAATSTKGIGAEAEKSGSRLSNMSGSMKLAAAAAAGFVATRIVGFLSDSARAAGEDDKSQRLLALAIENTTDSTQAQIDKNEQWIDGMARGTGVADDQLRPALANLVRTHGDLSTAQGDLGIALDISAAKGLDVETVAKAMAKAHDGNTGSLKKLGLQVQDTEGNLLTYEQVLAKASETMGGAAGEAAASLAGQLERQKVAAEESAEAFGAKVIPVQSHWQGLLGVLISELGPATEQSIARMNLQFNDLVNSGVDPASNKLASFITILASSEDTASATEGSLEMLSGMLGVTAAEFGTASDYIRDNADALGLNADEVDNITGLLDAESHKVKDTTYWTGAYTAAIEANTTATQEQIAAKREALDPLFALIATTDRAKEAEDKYTEAVKLHGDYSKEAFDASIDLAKAQSDLNGAATTYAEEGGANSIAVLKETLTQAGLMPDVIQEIIDKIEQYNATPVKNPFRVDLREGAGNRVGARASGGPVYAHQMYRAGEGNRPELMVIPGDNGRIFSNSDSRALIAAMSGGGSNTQISVSGFTRNLDESIRLAGMYAGISRRIEARRH